MIGNNILDLLREAEETNSNTRLRVTQCIACDVAPWWSVGLCCDGSSDRSLMVDP